MTRSISLALLISVIGLLVIGGPIANALFQSPLDVPASAAVAQTSTPVWAPSIASKISWVVFGAVIAAGIVLTVSRRSRPV